MICNNKYGKYSVPNHNTPTVKIIKKGGVYEPDTIKFIIDNLNNKAMIHAGTYFGDFLPAISKATRGNIFAFEPNNENYKCAKETIKLNRLNNVVLHNSALSSFVGEVSFKTSKNNVKLGGGSHIVNDGDEGDCVEKINTNTIDFILENKDDNISIIQLDVEGHEEDALIGALNTIKKYKPIIIIENRVSNSFYEKELKPLGYKYSTRKVHMNYVLLK